METPKAQLSKKLLRVVGRANGEYGLIGEGDKIMVGLSGGKDSLALVHVLAHMKRVAPFSFDFVAATVDYGMGENLTHLQNHCREYGIPHKVIATEIFDIAQNHIRENSSFCSFFSRMRRGALYTAALEEGCNKLALGHHLDDAVESFFMNFFYNGAMRSLAPIYRADNGLLVIRPLIWARERQLADNAVKNGFEPIGDEACPAMRFPVKMPVARAKTKQFLHDLEQEHPELFTMAASAFRHLHDETFFDKSRFGI